VKDIQRATRRHFSAEDKVRIVLEGLRGDDSNTQYSPQRRNAHDVAERVKRFFEVIDQRRALGSKTRPAPKS